VSVLADDVAAHDWSVAGAGICGKPGRLMATLRSQRQICTSAAVADRGPARKIGRQRQDGWGDYRMMKTTWLDVSIPFVGEAETLRIGPSSMTLLDRRATIGRNTLTIRVTDDDRAEAVGQNF